MTGEASGKPAEWPRSTAIIGAGTMGLGVAASFTAAGIHVRLCDASSELAQHGREQLVERVRGHIDAGLLEEKVAERAEKVEAADDVSDAAGGVDFVFEAAPEQFELKREILAASDAATPPEAVIATNTSSLPVNELATALRHSERFLGTHWFNPPEWTPGVEIIPASATNQGTVGRVKEFLQAIGKRPAIVGDGPGFVANRIQMALFREALACVEDGLGSLEEVDEVVRSCFGFRLPFFGPFQIADMAGLDVYQSIFGTLESSLGERFRTPDVVRELADQGRTGTKPKAVQDSWSTRMRSGIGSCWSETSATRPLMSCSNGCRPWRWAGIRVHSDRSKHTGQP